MATSAKLPDFDSFSTSEIFLRIIGFWPLAPSRGAGGSGPWRPLTWLHRAYSVCISSAIYLAYPLCEVVDCLQSAGDLDTLTENICLTGNHFGGVLKFLLIVLKKERIMEFFHAFDHTMSQVSSANNSLSLQKEATSVMKQTKSKSDRLRKVYLYVVTLCGVLSAAYPLTDMSILGRHFPYRAWLPAALAELTVFVYCYKTVAVLILALMILESDHVFVELILHLTAQTFVLRQSIRALGTRENGDCENNNGDLTPVDTLPCLDNQLQPRQQRDSSQLNYLKQAEWNQTTYQHFKNCIIHHQHILKLSREIEELFSNIILMQFFLSITGLCLSGLQVTIGNFDGAFVAMTAYFFCTLTEILLYCFFTNELIIESGKLSYAAYESMWITSDLKLRRALLVFMERTKVPIYITAGGFFQLSLETFTQILSKAYSTLVVLRNVICDKNC